MKWLTGFTFKREAAWLMVLYVLVPLIGLIIAFVIPTLSRGR